MSPKLPLETTTKPYDEDSVNKRFSIAKPLDKKEIEKLATGNVRLIKSIMQELYYNIIDITLKVKFNTVEKTIEFPVRIANTMTNPQAITFSKEILVLAKVDYSEFDRRTKEIRQKERILPQDQPVCIHIAQDDTAELEVI